MTAVQEHTHGTATGSPAERFTSRNPDDFAIPRGREEEWRFTPLRKIRDYFEPFEADGQDDAENYIPAGASLELVPPSSVAAFGTALTPADRVSALAMTYAEVGMHLRVDAGVELAEPIRITRVGVSGRGYGHHIVEVGANARATLIVDLKGLVQGASNVELVVGDGAALDLILVNDTASGSVQLSSYGALVGRDASLRMVNVTLGGSLVRVAQTVRFAGPGGTAELLGLSFAGDEQHFESRIFVDHNQPQCTSNVLYKNALDGDSARTVWIGDVRIRPAAKGTQTYEMNRNLVLSDGARADSVPNLEIETGDIAGAGHASATGRFDDLQLFYLQSRGIPEEAARRLVVRGFFADIVERIGLPDLEQQIMASIEARLGYIGDDAESLTAELENDPA